MGTRERLRAALGRNPVARAAMRARNVWAVRRFALGRKRAALRYVLRGRQLSNFYYEMENEDDAARMVADATGVEPAAAAAMFAELRADTKLLARLEQALGSHQFREPVPRFGYRLVLYAAIRIAKPARVAEIGTHDGLASSVMVAALERNQAEGTPGELVTFDLNPAAGWLIDPATPVSVLQVIGDVSETVPAELRARRPDFLVEDIGDGFTGKESVVELAESLAPVLMFHELGREPWMKRAAARGAEGRYGELHELSRDFFFPGCSWGLAEIPAADN